MNQQLRYSRQNKSFQFHVFLNNFSYKKKQGRFRFNVNECAVMLGQVYSVKKTLIDLNGSLKFSQSLSITKIRLTQRVLTETD